MMLVFEVCIYEVYFEFVFWWFNGEVEMSLFKKIKSCVNLEGFDQCCDFLVDYGFLKVFLDQVLF